MKYPGIGAMWYRPVMNAIWKYIFGWDWNKGTVSNIPNLYGIMLDGAVEATEEQNRKTLHAHGIGFSREGYKILQDLQAKCPNTVQEAKNKILEIHEQTASTFFRTH